MDVLHLSESTTSISPSDLIWPFFTRLHFAGGRDNWCNLIMGVGLWVVALARVGWGRGGGNLRYLKIR